MKTLAFIFSIFTLFSISISGQTRPESKSDSLKIGVYSFKHVLNDTLKLDNPFVENNLPLPDLKNKQSGSNPDLTLIPRYGHRFAKSNFRMPIYNPDSQSKMPILIPDSTILYHMPIQHF